MADKAAGIKVTGAKELRSRIRKAENQGLKSALKVAYRDAANIVVRSARPNAPVRSGALRASIRPLGGATSSVVAAGRGRTSDYAGVIHYGWPARNITPQPFIHEALRDEWDKVYSTFEDAIDDVTKRI